MNKEKGFKCAECGQILESPLTRHTYEDCQSFKTGEVDCKNCGTKLVKDWKYCPECGTKK
jgi:DNA-directed RNA polymerase subunit RPC12/RpoP